MNEQPTQFDGLTLSQIIEKKIGKALPEAEKVDIKDARTLADAIAFLSLVDSIFKELNREWKSMLEDLTEAGLVLRDKIERYKRMIPAPEPRKGPNAKMQYDSAIYRETHPKKKLSEKQLEFPPKPEKNLFDDI